METALNLDLNKRYTYADYLTWWDDKRRELIDGFVKMMSPAASSLHEEITINIVTDLKVFIRKNKGQCKVYSAPFDVRLFADTETEAGKADTVVQPDICVVCDKSKIDRRGCAGAPDMVVEILSPSSLRYDLVEKFALYETAGVREYWVVNPDAPSIHVFRLQPDGKYDKGVVYEEETDCVPVHIFEGLYLKWGDIFEE
jgi:Uma2 family endonuclease